MAGRTPLPTEPVLAGLRVLDLSTFLAGPFCTQILADLGAEIIKLEPPAGDATRTLPPYFYKGESAYFLSVNCSKESVVLDLATDAGRAVFRDLVRQVDIVVDNYRAATKVKLQIEYETLREINPRVINCSISGFGQDGPYADLPAYDMVIQALSGGMSITGERDGRPVRSGIPIGDLAAGQFAAISILAAVHERDRTGLGQAIDISMLDVQIAMLSYQGVYYLMSGDVPGPQGRGHASIPTYTAITAGDGRDVLMCANTERMWRSLCDAIDLGVTADDPLFATNERRLANRVELQKLLDRAFGRHDSGEILRRLQAAGIPCARVSNLAEALSDPQVVHRDMVRTVPHTLGGSIEVLGDPIKFSRTDGASFRSPPLLGEHTRAVLSEVLGYGEDRLADLRNRGAFGADEVNDMAAVAADDAAAQGGVHRPAASDRARGNES